MRQKRVGGSLKAILEFINEQFFIDTATNLVQMKDSIKNVSIIFFLRHSI